MQEYTNTDRPRVEISIRATAHLASKHKHHPEQQVRKYVERAFERLNLPYRIVSDLPPVEGIPAPGEGTDAQLDAFSDQLNADDPLPAVCKDSNLLLTDRDGGGRSFLGMKGAVGPGGTLDQQCDMAEWASPDDPRHCIFGCLHEIGHNLSRRAGHDNGWGQAWTDVASSGGQFWYRTPMATPDDHNACGEWNAPRPDGSAKRDCLYYADCAREEMKIRPADYLDKGGD